MFIDKLTILLWVYIHNQNPKRLFRYTSLSVASFQSFMYINFTDSLNRILYFSSFRPLFDILKSSD